MRSSGQGPDEGCVPVAAIAAAPAAAASAGPIEGGDGDADHTEPADTLLNQQIAGAATAGAPHAPAGRLAAGGYMLWRACMCCACTPGATCCSETKCLAASAHVGPTDPGA